MEEAASANDKTARIEALEEGKKFLKERNKHILLAEKYGWEAVECYIQELLACDSDEKCIRRAVKESKVLKSDNNKSSKPRATFVRSKQPFTSNQNSSSTRRVITPALITPAPAFVAGEQGILPKTVTHPSHQPQWEKCTKNAS